jgi:hypothetical protein
MCFWVGAYYCSHAFWSYRTKQDGFFWCKKQHLQLKVMPLKAIGAQMLSTLTDKKTYILKRFQDFVSSVCAAYHQRQEAKQCSASHWERLGSKHIMNLISLWLCRSVINLHQLSRASWSNSQDPFKQDCPTSCVLLSKELTNQSSQIFLFLCRTPNIVLILRAYLD